MKVVLAGNKSISAKCLEWMAEEGAEILSVFGHKDKAASLDWQESLKEVAEKYNLPFFDGNINDHAEMLREQNPDVIFSIQYGPLVKKSILDIPTKGCVNLHNGDLPRYGGCGPVYHALLNGETEMAVTLHYMDENFDTGAIIDKEYVQIGPNENSQGLFDAVTNAGFELFKRQYHQIRNGTNTRSAQKGKKLYYGKDVLDFNRADQRAVSWSGRANDVHNQIRAFTFPNRGWFPVSSINEETVELAGSEIKEDSLKIKRYGEIINIHPDRIQVATRDNHILVESINGVNSAEYCKDSNIKEGDYFV